MTTMLSITKRSSFYIKLYISFIALIVFTSCHHADKKGGGSGFAEGHMVKGRYSNSDAGIKSFTFYENGKFERGGAASGYANGTDYVAGSTNAGTYSLSGNTLKLNYDGGQSEEMTIEVTAWDDKGPDYTNHSPTQLRINKVSYTNVD